MNEETLREQIAHLMFYDHGRNQETHSCSCGWKVNRADSRVYEWQYRLHLTDAILNLIAKYLVSPSDGGQR